MRIGSVGYIGLSSRRTGPGTGAVPSVALHLVGGNWFVDDASTTIPDGYFAFVGDNLFIDPAALSGEPIAVVGSNILVGS